MISMDESTKKYLDEQFERMVTKEDLRSEISGVESRIGETLHEMTELIDRRFDAVDARFNKIEEKLDPLVNQVSGHEKRLSFLEDRVL
jgi:predicted nuclease with TOPRIM domain